MVTVLVPLDTVIVPGEVDVTVSPLSLNIAEVGDTVGQRYSRIRWRWTFGVGFVAVSL